MSGELPPLTRESLKNAIDKMCSEPFHIKPDTCILSCPKCKALLEVMDMTKCPICGARWNIDNNTRVIRGHR